jgi:ATP-dependent RNA helicase RhlE
VDKKQKGPLLIKLTHDGGWDQALVFTKTKHRANKLTKQLDAAGITAAAIHGNKSQGARTKALADFKAGEIRILVATDIAARGLDIEQLPQVVNFDLPNVSEDYVHRIGRTGRAGATGQAISLVSADEVDLLSDIERLTQRLLERREIDGFEPDQNLPETTLNKPVRRKKPRKALNSESNSRDNSRHNNKSSTNKKRSAYGHGPKPGGKLKSGGRNQTSKPGQRSEDSSESRSDSRGNSAPRKPSGNSPYGSGGGRNASGRNRPSGGNSNRGSGRSGNR